MKSGSDTSTRIILSATAALFGGATMLLLRLTLQVRSVPERLVDWVLLFVPPSVFEAILQQLGFDAKRYALYLGILIILGLLVWLGYVALRAEWSLVTICALGVGLWLAVMTLIMPLTSAGLFALDLLDGKRAAIGGYLSVALAYSGALALVRVWTAKPRLVRVRSRRVAIGLLGGAVGSYIATNLAVLLLPHQVGVPDVVLEDPQQTVPLSALETTGLHGARVEDAVAPAIDAQAPSASAVSLPEPSMPRTLTRDKDGAVIPSGREPGQLARPITLNSDFYIVTKNAAGDPVIHLKDWHLLVDGEVRQPFKLDYATLRRLPAIQVTKTLECISNFVGKPELAPFGAELISTAVWTGVPVRDILDIVGGPKPTAVWAVAFGADEYTSALPLQAVMDPAALVVYEMNGDVLPYEHGYPARLLVPNRYGMKNPKWLNGLRLMTREYADWYGQRNWSKTAVVQTMCRIDTPAPGSAVSAGTHRVAGVAYAGTRGISRVELSIDNGRTWGATSLSDPRSAQDRWVAWQASFDVATGVDLTIIARATDGTGAIQAEAFSLPEPDGGSGWARVTVHAR